MTDIPTFLAHALALETEAHDRYNELADALETHNNPEVAALFRSMAGFSLLHAQAVRERSQGYDLPRLKSWEYEWTDAEGPETTPVDRAHYLMTPWHCLQVALNNERRGQVYYATVAAGADDPELRRLAEEFAAEEADHVAILEQRLAHLPRPGDDWDHDTDPPVISD